jgi:hypothetical protein
MAVLPFLDNNVLNGLKSRRDSHRILLLARVLMQSILDEFRGSRKQELKDVYSLFLRIIARLEDIYQVRPFNQQTAQSLTELFALVQATQPRTIFELGAGSRSSPLALSLAAARMSPRPTIFSLDVAPVDFKSLTKTHFPDLRLAPVHDVAMEATRFSIPQKWEHPIFMLYDAHNDDLPGIKSFLTQEGPGFRLCLVQSSRCTIAAYIRNRKRTWANRTIKRCMHLT